jgi:hypothetical protein
MFQIESQQYEHHFSISVQIGSQEPWLLSPGNRTHRKTPGADLRSGPETTLRTRLPAKTQPLDDRGHKLRDRRFGSAQVRISVYINRPASSTYPQPARNLGTTARDRVGRGQRSVGPTENRSRFLAFLQQIQ